VWGETDSDQGTILCVFYFIVGVPGSWGWYQRVYKAARNSSSRQYLFFFAAFFFHCGMMLLIGLGTPPLLTVYSLACMANLTAGLTHYGTTTAPIVFAAGYVGLRDWWRVGLLVSFVNLAIWLTVGFAWWKLLGFW